MHQENPPAKVASNAQLGLLPITRHDHPEPQTMVWSDLELQAIRAYAGRCVAAERARGERIRVLAEQCAEWHIGDGDKCGTIARELLALLRA